MKKNICLLCAILLLVVITGCSARPQAFLTRETRMPDIEGIDKNLLVETGPQYAINVQAPVTRSAKINKDIDGIITEQINMFIENASQPVEEDWGDSQLIIEYETHYYDDTHVTFVFKVYYYMAGAAHGNSYSITRTYNLVTGEKIELADLFAPGSDYLGRLSQLSRRALASSGQLGEDYDQDWVEEGTAPLEENFARFVPLPNGLMLIFDPYQIGPWAIGEQRVTIPWSDLQDILR